MKKFFLILFLVWLPGCVNPGGPDQITIQPEHAPIWVKSVFQDRYPSRTIEAIEADVFQEKIQGYRCFFKDDDGTMKSALIGHGGKIGEATVVARLPQIEQPGSLQLTVGMLKSDALKIVRQYGGQDITGGMQLGAPPGIVFKKPAELYWAFDSCNAVIGVFGGERVEHLSYWKGDDFEDSKERRERTERKVRAIELGLKTRLVSIQPINDE